VKGDWLRPASKEVRRLDLAIYQAVARTRTPTLDAALTRLSRAADYSRISIGLALALAVAGGPPGRRAAIRGMASVAVTATVVNIALKPVTRRRRPDRPGSVAGVRGRVRMPRSHSFPSGHAAAAFAFAAGASSEMPPAGTPLFALAGLVGYSRIHTGVHYPLDVVTGALCGIALAELTGVWLDRLQRHDPSDAIGLLQQVDQPPHDQ
jgi:membrane-associated phospholipid phosphatase